jgi:hypothetical protein
MPKTPPKKRKAPPAAAAAPPAAAPKGNGDTTIIDKDKVMKEYTQSLQEHNAKLAKEITTLKAKIRKLEKSAVTSQAGAPTIPKQPILTHSDAVSLLIDVGGLSRYTLFQDEWHTRNPNATTQLFGYDSWDDCKEAIKLQFGIPICGPQIYYGRTAHKLKMNQFSTELEQCLAVKMMDRTGLTTGRICLLFGVNERTVRQWRSDWCPKWGLDKNVDPRFLRNGDHRMARKHLSAKNQKTKKNEDEETNEEAEDIGDSTTL